MNLFDLAESIKGTKRCERCLVTNHCPVTSVDDGRVCNHCRNHERGGDSHGKHFCAEADEECRKDLENTLSTIRGKGRYDVLVGFSGGKDSTYLIYRLMKDYPHLRIMPATIDMGLLSPVAIENVQQVANRLDLDHVFLKPRLGLYRKLFKYLFEHRPSQGYKAPSYEERCWNEKELGFCDYCHGFNDGVLLRYATEQQIPLVLTGLSPGQPWYWFYEMPKKEICEDDHTPAFTYNAPFTEEDRQYFWNPKKCPPGTEFPRVLFPYHVWRWHADDIRRELHQAGVLSAKKSSSATTNCHLNYLMALIDYQVDGYFCMTPYAGKVIRHGMAEKREWEKSLRIVELLLGVPPRSAKHLLSWMMQVKKVKELEQWLDLDAEELIKRYRREKADRGPEVTGRVDFGRPMPTYASGK